MATLRRQSLVAYGASLVATAAELPRPQGSEVLVRIAHCGVCHSDLHMQDGYFRLAADKRLDITAGRTLPWRDGQIAVEDAATADYSGLDIALFSAGAEVIPLRAPGPGATTGIGTGG